jgi:excinuclease ABC subunit C
MDHLFVQPHVLDFGPARLHTAPALLRHLFGDRPAQLRRGVREQCPRQPGVYGMLDLHGELIYIGKAKNLRARLLTYFRPRSRDAKAGRVIGQARGLLWEASADEFAALHRELELIRRWRPRFNIQGKPHSWQHTYVCIGRAPAPYVYLARRPPARVQECFGPIPAGGRAREAVRRLNDWFRLRDCAQKQALAFVDQAELFPVEHAPGCLRLELNTCLGPCAAACTRADYTQQVRAAAAFLGGSDPGPLAVLERQMQQASSAQQFERAGVLRDKLAALAWLHRQLEQVRQAALMQPLLYPVAGHDGTTRWYVIRQGRAVAAVVAPAAPDAAAAARRLPAPPLGSAGGEHLAGIVLLAAWFRRYPQERDKLVPLPDSTTPSPLPARR